MLHLPFCIWNTCLIPSSAANNGYISHSGVKFQLYDMQMQNFLEEAFENAICPIKSLSLMPQSVRY